MSIDLVTAWSPGPRMRWRFRVDSGVGTHPPRASWAMIAEALAGRVSERWRAARALHLDGPLATDASLQRLVDAGCLDGLERLHLESECFTARGVSLALGLPALKTLTLEGIALSTTPSAAAPSLSEISLIGCPPDTSLAVLRAAPEVTAVHVESSGRDADHRALCDLLGGRRLSSLAIAHATCAPPMLANALRGSEGSLATLALTHVADLDSDEFLAGRSWPALRFLQWHGARARQLGAHLPPSLEALSVRESGFARLELDGAWVQNLTCLDATLSSSSEELAARIEVAPERLVKLGLRTGAVAMRVVAALSRMADASLRSLELGDRLAARSSESRVTLVDEVPDRLASLVLHGASPPGEALLCDLVRGDRAPGLHTLRLVDTYVGQPDLGRRFSPRLRRLDVNAIEGAFLEALGADEPLALESLHLEDVGVNGEELAAMLARCTGLRSLRIDRVHAVGPEHLAQILAHVGATLVRLELGGFSDDAVPDYGDTLLASQYPALAELDLDDSLYSELAFAHLMRREVTPALECLYLDYPVSDDEWLSMAQREPSALHWFQGHYNGKLDALDHLLRAPDSGVAHAQQRVCSGDAMRVPRPKPRRR